MISNEEDLLPLVKSLRDTHHIFSLRGSIAFHPGYTYLTSRRVRGAAPPGAAPRTLPSKTNVRMILDIAGTYSFRSKIFSERIKLNNYVCVAQEILHKEDFINFAAMLEYFSEGMPVRLYIEQDNLISGEIFSIVEEYIF